MAVDRQAADVLLLDMSQIGAFADFFVIMSAESRRQLATLAEEIARQVTQLGESSPRQEGAADSGWVLLDCGDVIVHIFSPELRGLYRLERVWSHARLLLRVQ